jgi:hypothetical protein
MHKGAAHDDVAFDNATAGALAAMPADPSAARLARGAGSNLRRFVIWMLIGIGLGVTVMLIALRQLNYDPTPSLTPKLFHAAHERWKANPVASYDVEIGVTGPQAATYRVEVRDGQPQAAWRNGKPLTNRRTFGTWSVPGMFATISRDIEAIERAAAKGAPLPLILRAEFDGKYAYPARYRRIDNGSRKGGDSIAVTWDVIEFRLVRPGETEP